MGTCRFALNVSCNVMVCSTGLNLSDNRIEERGVYALIRELLSPDEQECALISLVLHGNPGCDARAQAVFDEMNMVTSRSPMYSALRPDVAAVLLKWTTVKKRGLCVHCIFSDGRSHQSVLRHCEEE